MITPRTAIERLVAHLVGGPEDDALADELRTWLADSPRFRAFAEANRDKIRKKLRTAADDDARRDVRAELRVAHLLLADPRIGLTFEAYGSGRAGPDFTVGFRGARSFNLEVTRLRRAITAGAAAGPLLAKLRQLPPSTPNAVLIAIDADDAGVLDIAGSVRELRARADAKDDAFFVARGFDGSRGFYDRYLRLGAVVVWSERADGDARTIEWINPSARIAVPERAFRSCLARLRAG